MVSPKSPATFACGSKRESYDTGADYSDDDTSDKRLPFPASQSKKQRLTAGKDNSHLDSEQKTPPKPAPYFFYTDHSREADHDPLSPVTQSGTVPSFPIKMHALLSKTELSDVLAWDSHGRSFRILKPRQFEAEILPRYFDHSKFSSFTRQVNGWGFRRLTEGENMGSYYEEHFLRSMPWLCKLMKRPKVGEKWSICAQHEPDLAAISKEFPVPSYAMTREIRIVLETMARGPKAKMPEQWLLEGEELNPTVALPFAMHLPSLHDSSNDNSKSASRLERHDHEALARMPCTAPPAATSARTGEVNSLSYLLHFLQQSGNVDPTTNTPITRQVSAPVAVPLTSTSIESLLQGLKQGGTLGSMTFMPNSRQVSAPPAIPPRLTSIQSDDMLNNLLLSLQHSGSVGTETTLSNTRKVSVSASASPHLTSNQDAPMLTALLQSFQHRGNVGFATGTSNDCQITVPAAAASPQVPIQNAAAVLNLLQSLQHDSNIGSMAVTPSISHRNFAHAHNMAFSAAVTRPSAMASPYLLTTLPQSLQHNGQVPSMTGSSHGLTTQTGSIQYADINMQSTQNFNHPLTAEQIQFLIKGMTKSNNASDRC
ncbi:hypothetical protein HJC23_007930 [Cyclotella cryptica]|uniref:HSF-type DNA-binding domain-containing protein n=1 Tax=Cyclotella cryptica TaxID=29204 RepID=A0ABD3NI79_9STRA|eukprot:CCRYP_021168-RA/>CCRYP_021168-RA protein AED:0.09 eAED:0.09 QI:421/1/1/1/1/1/2/284/596